jgi:hypothetical protein
MKITAAKMIFPVVAGLGLAAFIVASIHRGYAPGQVKASAPTPEGNQVVFPKTKAVTTSPSASVTPAVAPFIVQDTATDSPGTNMVTRIVTFTAQVGGAPPPALQWEVDRGNGFAPIAGATRPVFRIGNAQVSDSGQYALFATNSAGGLHTTPVPLFVTEGED